MILSPLRKSSGFTLVETVMVIGLVSILAVGMIGLLTNDVNGDRYDETVTKIRAVRAALIGDTNVNLGGSRASFGYLGDMGGLPSTAQGLAALSVAPAGAAAYSVDAVNRFGHGWNGPYLSATIGGKDPFKDAWGRNFTYTFAANTATITSLGADGAAGGTGVNQDLVVTISPEQWKGTVYGFLTDGAGSFTGQGQVEIRRPDGNGGVATSLFSVPNGSQGQFQFIDIPFGNRSLMIYSPSKAIPTRSRGPFSIMVDQAHELITPNLTNFNP
ncbi:MAG: type II secretion system protein GspG [Bdellovibrionota bacterium]